MANDRTEFDNTVEELLPRDDFPISDAELENQIEDDRLLDPDPVIVVESEPQPIGRSWAFDFISNRFYPKPGGGPQGTRGLTTLRFWIEKVLRTYRGAYPIYDSRYGIEDLDEIIGHQIGDASMTSLSGKIEDALLFHPSITAVTDFSADFNEVDEALVVSFVVVTDQGDELPINDLALVL